MDEDQVIDDMIEALETNGEIRFSGEDQDLFVQSVDDKEGYSYVSNTHKEFEDSREAVEWAIEQFDGVENIDDWE